MKDYIEVYDEYSGRKYYVLPCGKCKHNEQKQYIKNGICFITPWCYSNDVNTATMLGCSDGIEVD